MPRNVSIIGDTVVISIRCRPDARFYSARNNANLMDTDSFMYMTDMRQRYAGHTHKVLQGHTLEQYLILFAQE